MRSLALLLLTTLSTGCSAFFEDSVEASAATADSNVYAGLTVTALDGAPVALEDYSGEVALIVNTASKCGYTPQYAGLQQLHESFADRGLQVLGFPSADFGGQEYDTSTEIASFCTENYGVTFPLFERTGVKEGPEQSELFARLGAATGSLPGWNFGKYLVGRNGRVIGFFDTRTKPDDAELVAAIEAALAAN